MSLVDVIWGSVVHYCKLLWTLIGGWIRPVARSVARVHGRQTSAAGRMSRPSKRVRVQETEVLGHAAAAGASACKFDDMRAVPVGEAVAEAAKGGRRARLEAVSTEADVEGACGCPKVASEGGAPSAPRRRRRRRAHDAQPPQQPPQPSQPAQPAHGPRCSQPADGARTRPSARSRWQNFKRTLQRFGDLFILSVWLVSAVRLPPAMAAPLGSMDAVRLASKPKWINPCGGEPNAELYASDLSESRSSDGSENSKPFESILLAARLAKDTAEQFKEKYVQQTFNVGFAEWHDNWKSKHYDWLPSPAEIPKNLGESTPRDHLQKLELDSALKDIYRYLQMYAVGLEQVTWDQEDIKGDFWSSFKDAEHALKATLCEVQALMVERSVRPHPDVQRDLMDGNVRQNSNTSHRNLRDWLIYRDYMNGLEYVIEVLEHFERGS